MNDLIFCYAIFVITVTGHVCIFRLLEKLRIRTFKSVFVFLIGLVILILPNPLDSQYRQTSIVIYLLFSVIWSLLFISVYYRDLSPTFKILTMAGKKKRFSAKEVMAIFSERELILNRLDGLESSGQIRRKSDRYYVSCTGLRLISLINFYRKILNWNQGG